MGGLTKTATDYINAIKDQTKVVIARENPDIGAGVTELSTEEFTSKVEKLPSFNLSLFQILIVSLLTISVLINLRLLFISNTTFVRIDPFEVNWDYEIKKVGLGKLNMKAVKRYIQVHTKSPANTFRYSKNTSILLQNRVDGVLVNVVNGKKKLKETFEILQQLEIEAFWVGYWNWIRDGIENSDGCRGSGSVGRVVGGCDGISALWKEVADK